MTIRVKLFLTFLLTTLVVVMGMHLFTRWSLEKGFTEFVEKREKERVNTLVEELEEHYAETQGWEKLAASKQNWILLLWRADSQSHRPPRHIIR
ncbi:MAG: two-component sensor histidine kinase, partial [Methylicorpusculum sp.]|nr:two-component sensor histidine kinase [Methylicorpusculum sp.]